MSKNSRWPFVVKFRILLQTAAIVALVLAIKIGLHALDWEIVAVSPLHPSIVAGGIFILSIFLTGILPDYKEAERLPCEFTATIDSMFGDAIAIKKGYPGFDSAGLREALTSALEAFRNDIVHNKRGAYRELHEIGDALVAMDAAKVPPNFIVKLKQEQATLIRILLRLYYIQRVRFIPSAYYLVVSTAVLVIGILLLTKLEPFNASVAGLGLVAFVFVYLLKLIGIASTPFKAEGTTQDDVSLFLIRETLQHLGEEEAEERRKEGHDDAFYRRLKERHR